MLRRLRHDFNFIIGLLSLRPDVKKQASPALAVGRLQGLGPQIQEKPEDPLPCPPH